MARLAGRLVDKKTDNVVVYEMRGHVYVRMKSSLTRQRVLRSKAFEKTREFAGNMAKSARVGSEIYKQLSLAKKNRALYQAITGIAASLFYKGKDETEVIQVLQKKFGVKKL